jgi:hypothetical protein
MVPNTQTDSITGDDARHSLAGCATEARTIRAAALELASSLSWLPGSPSSDTLSKRCQKLVAAFKSVFGGVDAAFSQAPNSEDLLWLRNNTQQLSSAARVVASELGPLTALPVVSNQHEILPRVLAIAESFFDKADFILSDAALSKVRFTEFCMVFEETTPLEFHEIGALVPALKLVLLEQIAVRGNCLVKNPTSKDCKRVVPCIRILQNVTQTSWEDELEALIPFDGILRKDPAGAFATMDVESRKGWQILPSALLGRSCKWQRKHFPWRGRLTRKHSPIRELRFENPTLAITSLVKERRFSTRGSGFTPPFANASGCCCEGIPMNSSFSELQS